MAIRDYASRQDMCGIAGIIGLNGEAGDYRLATMRMAQAMRTRGPDDEGYLTASHGSVRARAYSGADTPPERPRLPYTPEAPFSAAPGDGQSVWLAHRRLSIVDLSMSGHQPMCTEDGRFWVIYNGEIYNHKIVRQQLEAAGERFHSTSDTEVLLLAYRRWGEACLERFLGMFAFSIWDDHEKTLFLARDRLGVKPLYFTRVDNLFVFASNIRTLAASGLYRAQPDMEGLYLALSFGVAPRPLTAFRNVRALEQGHWMRIDARGNIERGRYWAVPAGTQHAMDEKAAVGLIEEKLTAAVELRLNADVPVGAFMSGGIDSTTVAAIAASRHPGITAFTLAFRSDPNLDELEQARATAAMHGMNHVVRDIEPERAVDHINDMVLCYEEPFYDLSPNYLISQLVHESGMKVILNGLGGDELFGGYPYFRWTSRWHALRRTRLLYRLAECVPALGHLAQRLHAIGRASSADRFALAVRCFLTDREKQSLFLDSSVRELDTVERIHDLYVGGDMRFSSDFDAMSYIDMVNYVGNHHVYRVDMFTMRFSLEARLPFLDHRLVEAAFSIPDHLKIRGARGKYVLRQVARKYVHPSCLAAAKKGFDLPTDKWMRGKLRGVVLGALDQLGRRGMFDSRMIDRIHREWRIRARSFRGVWELVALELWLQNFIDRPA